MIGRSLEQLLPLFVAIYLLIHHSITSCNLVPSLCYVLIVVFRWFVYSHSLLHAFLF